MKLLGEVAAEIWPVYTFYIEKKGEHMLMSQNYNIIANNGFSPSVEHKCSINITPMSMKNGVLGIPIAVCRVWEALYSIGGTFIYAGVSAQITATPKHIDTKYRPLRAKAWQFTVNNNKQYAQLREDGVNTYIDNKRIGEMLKCTVECCCINGERQITIVVTDVVKKPDGRGSELIRDLIQQQKISFRETKSENKSGISWHDSTGWIDIGRIDKYSNIHQCIYMWWGCSIKNAEKRYLYVGIVGNIGVRKKQEKGISKRVLSQRIKEEIKSFREERGIEIKQFRYVALKDSDYPDTAQLLKTVEMQVITAITAIIPCEGAQNQISPLLTGCEIELVNQVTKYH